MFTDRPDFQEARLFQLANSSCVLEISSLTGASVSRERVLRRGGMPGVTLMVSTVMH